MLRTSVILTTLLCATLSSLDGHGADRKPRHPLKKLQFDPSAATVELFDGIESGQLDVQVIPKNALGANVLIKNTGNAPLNVKLPSAVIALPKHLAQFGGAGGGLGGNGLTGGLGGQGGFGGGGGQQQLGGGFGGLGGGGGGLGGGGLGGQGGGGFLGGGGFGSIPPEQVATISLNSVCLEHGKPEPGVSSRYVLVPVEAMSDNPVLHQLLALVGEGRVDPQAAQAAAWNLANRMSWQALADKHEQHLDGTPPTPYFTARQLSAAQNLVAAAQQQAKDAPPPAKAQTGSGRVSNAATPPKVGDIAEDFELRSVGGEKVWLSEVVKTSPVVLVVLRGFPGYQCPICNQQVGEFLGQAEKFKAAGTQVIFVYPGPSRNLTQRATEFLKDKTIPDHFQLLVDPDYSFTQAYRLRWDAPNETAYPATFVIQKERKITFATVSSTHGGRAKPEAILQALRPAP